MGVVVKRVCAEAREKCGQRVHVGGTWRGAGCRGVGNVDKGVRHQLELYLMKFFDTFLFT